MGTVIAQALPNETIDQIMHATRRRCVDLNLLARHGTTPLTKAVLNDRQINQAQFLAVNLYEAAASSGCLPVDMDNVTDFIGAAVLGIRTRNFG